MPPQLSTSVGAPDDDPGLRAAEQLVAREADEVGAAGEARGRRSARRRDRAARPSRDRRRGAARARCASSASSSSRGRSVKPTTRKFDWCTRRSSAVSGVIAPLVVGDARPVGRPDLDEPRPRARQDIRDPEAVADLDQLAAGDEHLASFGERGEREQHRGGVVVDHERGLGAGQPAEELDEVILPRAARARLEVVLEVRVAAPDLGDTASAAAAAAPARGSCARAPRSR